MLRHLPLFDIDEDAAMNVVYLGIGFGVGGMAHRREEVIPRLRDGESVRSILDLYYPGAAS